jgi:transcriptional regulator with XRE-family HTH domain
MMALEADLICNESMSQEKFVPNERLWHARTHKGWSQARLAEEVGTSFEMVSRWERGTTVPSPYYRERLCAVLGQSAEELGLLRGLQEPPHPLPAPLLFLACSHADAEKAVVSQLKVAFEKRGITLWSSRQFGRQAGAHPRKALQEVVCAAKAILVIISPEARSSRHVREALEMANMYQRPVCGVWIEGESWQACLPKEGSELAVWIDVRTAEDSARLEELVAAVQRLEVGSQESKLASLTAVEAREATWQPRNPYKGLRAFRREDAADFFGRDRLIAVGLSGADETGRPSPGGSGSHARPPLSTQERGESPRGAERRIGTWPAQAGVVPRQDAATAGGTAYRPV